MSKKGKGGMYLPMNLLRGVVGLLMHLIPFCFLRSGKGMSGREEGVKI